MIKRISLEEKRRITRAVYGKHGLHVEHFYPYTATPICPTRIRLDAADAGQARKAAEAAIAEAERTNSYGKKGR